MWGCGRGQRDFLSARDDDQAVVPGPLASVSTTSLASTTWLRFTTHESACSPRAGSNHRRRTILGLDEGGAELRFGRLSYLTSLELGLGGEVSGGRVDGRVLDLRLRISEALDGKVPQADEGAVSCGANAGIQICFRVTARRGKSLTRAQFAERVLQLRGPPWWRLSAHLRLWTLGTPASQANTFPNTANGERPRCCPSTSPPSLSPCDVVSPSTGAPSSQQLFQLICLARAFHTSCQPGKEVRTRPRVMVLLS